MVLIVLSSPIRKSCSSRLHPWPPIFLPFDKLYVFDWSRVEGAQELAVLMEWGFGEEDKGCLVLPIDEKELEAPECSQLAGFQLSRDLRRSRWL